VLLYAVINFLFATVGATLCHIPRQLSIHSLHLFFCSIGMDFVREDVVRGERVDTDAADLLKES
jgi:hypothetical protein